jgi:hypothetical protein
MCGVLLPLASHKVETVNCQSKSLNGLLFGGLNIASALFKHVLLVNSRSIYCRTIVDVYKIESQNLQTCLHGEPAASYRALQVIRLFT